MTTTGLRCKECQRCEDCGETWCASETASMWLCEHDVRMCDCWPGNCPECAAQEVPC